MVTRGICSAGLIVHRYHRLNRLTNDLHERWPTGAQLPIYWCYNGHFRGEPGFVSSVSIFFLCLFKKKTPANKCTGCVYGLEVLSVTQPTLPKHWREHKALSLTGELVSSFALSQPDSWQTGYRFLYTSSVINTTATAIQLTIITAM